MTNAHDNDDSGGSVDELRGTIAHLQQEVEVQRRVAFASGLFHGDITVSTLISAFGEGLLVIDNEQHIILINHRLEKLFGYCSDEIVGHHLQVLLPERFAAVHSQHVQTYVQNPHLRPMGQGLDLVARHKDGSEFPVEVSLSFLDTQAGRFALAFITDITHRKRAERALLEQNAALNAFAHTVAHDLQSSLGVIVGMSEYLLGIPTKTPIQQISEELTTIGQTGRKMSSIISELLLLASLRKNEVQLEPVAMRSVIGATLSRLEKVIEQHRAEVICSYNYPLVRGYAPWLEEVWFNYISNALKYGGEPPRIEIGGTEQPDGYVRFWVRDNGRGLTAEQQAEVFIANKRLESARAAGHGLGLSIVRQIIEKLDGQVSVESEPGVGSVFSFSLLKA